MTKKLQRSEFHRAQQELDEMSDQDMSTYLQRLSDTPPNTSGNPNVTPDRSGLTQPYVNPLKRSGEEGPPEARNKVPKLAAPAYPRSISSKTQRISDKTRSSSTIAMSDHENSDNVGIPTDTRTSNQRVSRREVIDLTGISSHEGLSPTTATEIRKASKEAASSKEYGSRKREPVGEQGSNRPKGASTLKPGAAAKVEINADPANSSYISSPESSPVSSQCHPAASSIPAAPAKAPTRKAIAKRSTLAVVPVRGAKSKKKVERKYSLSEWATKLQPGVYPPSPEDDGTACPADPPAKVQTLKGAVIFYCGGEVGYMSEATKQRVRHMVSYGATVLPSFDAEMVTHIVHDVRADVRTFLKVTGLKSLEWLPSKIPIVSWNWVVESQKAKKAVSYMDYASWRDAPPDYEYVKTSKWKIHRQTSVEPVPDEVPATGDVSHISEFTNPEISTQDGNSQMSCGTQPAVTIAGEQSPRSSPVPVRSRSASLGSETFSDIFSDFDPSSDRREASEVYRRRPRGFQCDQVGQSSLSAAACPNQPIIDKLKELQALHAAKPGDQESWRVFTYNKVISSLRSYPKPIETLNEAKGLGGVGGKTAQKIMEIVRTGALRRIEYENTEEVKVIKLFTGIYGVGPDTARKWFARGCRTLEDLKEGKGNVNLSSCQEIGLRYYDDINLRMPRVEAGQICDLIKPIALGIDPKIFIEIMGSYRRGKADCGDIDILISRDPSDGVTHAGVLEKLLRACKAEGVITEDLVLPESTDEEATELERVYRGLCRLPDVPGSHRRRIDFLTIDWHAKGAALLYYTGDDIFNRSMRLKARKLGYSLNQRGLWAGVVRDPRTGVKLHKGHLVASTTEQEIFDILDVPWQEPQQRIRGI